MKSVNEYIFFCFDGEKYNFWSMRRGREKKSSVEWGKEQEKGSLEKGVGVRKGVRYREGWEVS